MAAARPTVAVIIIGDEILKGQTLDTNSHFLCRELYKCGIKVSRVSVIPDDIDIIAAEVCANIEKNSFVFTSGGVGPTHDDVTYDGIAKAFNKELVLNEDLHKMWISICRGMGLDKAAAYKMSLIPESSKIHSIFTPGIGSFPVVSVKNLFIFAGIPTYLEHSFTQLKHLFCNDSVKYFCKSLYINANEFTIMDVLNLAVKEYDGVVKIGSYPDLDNNYFQVKLILEADSEESIDNAEAFLRSHLLHNIVVGKLPPNSEEALLMLENVFLERSETYDVVFAKAVETSLKVLEECYDMYPHSNICLSFNGGKDCTVLLHLAYMYLAKFFPERSEKIKVLYVRSKQPFTEIEDFIQLCVQRYNLDLIAYNNIPIKEALRCLQKDHPEIQAIIIGTRNTDPHCADVETFQMTDSDWPKYMRVNPLIPWTYSQVWKYLKTLEVPYCSLYDRGYTSLGCQHNTVPNAQLQVSTKEGQSYYLPAYMLKDPNEEREGRVNKI